MNRVSGNLINGYAVAIFFFWQIVFSPTVVSADWQQMYPWYPTHGFNDVFVADATNVFAVGNHGLLYRYNGSSWSVMNSPVHKDLHGIWGRSATDIYAVGGGGTILHYDGSTWSRLSSPINDDLYTVWGVPGPSGPVYAGGRNGSILQYSGGSWNEMTTGLYDGIWDYTIIYGIWGYSASNMYAIGYSTDGTDIFLKNNGSNNWDAITNFPGSSFRPTAIWGISGGLMYIGGSDGIYSLTNGATTWNRVLTDSSTSINDIWGTGSADIWAVGEKIYHYGGSTWKSVIDSVDPQNQWGGLYGIHGSTADNIYSVGAQGRIFSYQGNAWSPLTHVPQFPINAIWADSPNDSCAAGENGLLVRYDGTTWRPMSSATNNHLYGVCGWGNGHFMSVGAKGSVQYFNGTGWSSVNSGTTEDLQDIWCLAPDSAFVVGTSGTILNCNGTSCSPEVTDGTTVTLYSVYNSVLGTFAAGANGVLLKKDMTNTWSQVTPTPESFTIRDLWGNSTQIWAIGYDSLFNHGFIYTYTPGTDSWAKQYESGSSLFLKSASGPSSAQLRIAGNGGTYPYDGMVVNSSGTTVKSFPGIHFNAIAATGSDSLLVGGDQIDLNAAWHGQILQYDGTYWTSTIETNGLQDIWGRDQNSVFAVGNYGTILHFNGLNFTSMQSNTNTSLAAIYAGSNDDWAVATGGAGNMFYYDGSTWQSGSNSSAEWFSDIWGDGNNSYAVGTNGAVIQSMNRGANWSEMTNYASGDLNAITGMAGNGPLFAAGDDGLIIQYDTGEWNAMPSGAISGMDLQGIWAFSDSEAFTVGKTPTLLGSNETQILVYDGQSWQESYYSYNTGGAHSLYDVWGISTENVITPGSPMLQKLCGTDWKNYSPNSLPPLKKIWGTAGVNGEYHLFAISQYNSIFQTTMDIETSCSSGSFWNRYLPSILSSTKLRQ